MIYDYWKGSYEILMIQIKNWDYLIDMSRRIDILCLRLFN